MREIKFRGKSVKTNEWVYGYYWTNEIGNHFIRQIVDLNGCFTISDTEVDENTVGQYTGLKDLRGVEIYERDILKIPEWLIIDNQDKCICIYNHETAVSDIIGFGLYSRNSYWGTYTDIVQSDEWDEFEIIGNVYDNPELLKGGE